MSEIVLNTAYWKTRALELFRGEYPETDAGTQQFHEKYTHATDLYWELAQRVVDLEYEAGLLEDVADVGMVSYRWMYDSFRQDVRHQNTDQLDALIDYYQQHGQTNICLPHDKIV